MITPEGDFRTVTLDSRGVMAYGEMVRQNTPLFAHR